MDELTNTLADAAAEITSLRRQNEILRAKVEVFDSMMCLLHTAPAQHSNQALSVDVVYFLQKQMENIERIKVQPVRDTRVEAL